MRRLGPWSAALLALAAAAGPACAQPAPDDSIGRAISQPFRDLSLVRERPEELLMTAREAPYAAPASRECAALDADIAAFDLALGPDLDLPEVKRSAVGALASGAVKGAVSDVVELPFRGVVRRITGAEKRDKRMRQAVAAGMARRSYLKGLREGSGCRPPALAEQLASSPAS